MPSEKQIKALQEFAKWAIRESAFQAASLDGLEVQEKALSLGLLEQTVFDPEIHGYNADAEKGDWWFVFSSLLTAAEQAEPAPSTLIDTISDEVWNHDASKDNCLVVDRDCLSEPDPAARTSAVKVDVSDILLPMEDIHSDGGQCEWHDVANAIDEVRSHILDALEPAEPATDVEPVAVLEFARKQPGNENEMPRVVSCNWLPDGQYALYTRPPESRLREALESIANNTCCSGCQEAALVARAALAQEDGR